MSRATELAHLACRLIENGRPAEEAIASVIRQAAMEPLAVGRRKSPEQDAYCVILGRFPNGATLSELAHARKVHTASAYRTLARCIRSGRIVKRGWLYCLAPPNWLEQGESNPHLAKMRRPTKRKQLQERAKGRPGRPITSTHPRAAYWRDWYRRKKAKEPTHA